MSRLMRAFVALALLGLVAGAGVAGAQGGRNEFRAAMSGSQEKPPGPANARGNFKVEFRNGQACYRMLVLRLGGQPLAAHIHKGAAGVNGAIVIDLKPTFKGKSPRVAAKCVTAKASVVSAIRKNPAAYYVNVHTKANPQGAARGQLRADT
jgi:hypothetical protein